MKDRGQWKLFHFLSGNNRKNATAYQVIINHEQAYKIAQKN
jgi:hypothetical protein